jgi:transposase-like protein
MADTTRAKRARRRFSDEFKAQTVRLVLDEGKSVTAVARELDLVPSAVGVWVKLRAYSERSTEHVVPLKERCQGRFSVSAWDAGQLLRWIDVAGQ